MNYSTEERRRMAESGEAMADGSYPIHTTRDLHNAIQSFGRSPDAPTRAHITKRAIALERQDMLPKAWGRREKEDSMPELSAMGKRCLKYIEAMRGQQEKAYDETKHPRKPKGDPHGGKFADKHGAGDGAQKADGATLWDEQTTHDERLRDDNYASGVRESALFFQSLTAQAQGDKAEAIRLLEAAVRGMEDKLAQGEPKPGAAKATAGMYERARQYGRYMSGVLAGARQMAGKEIRRMENPMEEFLTFAREATPLGVAEKAGRRGKYTEAKHKRKPRGDPKAGEWTENPYDYAVADDEDQEELDNLAESLKEQAPSAYLNAPDLAQLLNDMATFNDLRQFLSGQMKSSRKRAEKMKYGELLNVLDRAAIEATGWASENEYNTMFENIKNADKDLYFILS